MVSRFCWLCVVAFSLFPQVLPAESVRLPVTKDNSIVMVDGEWNQNAGQQGRIRIKGNQHIVAMGFDTSAIVGKRVIAATLVCEQGDQLISGVTISTIATPWDEDRSSGLTAGVAGIEDWGYAGARFPAVCGGNGLTLVCRSESELRDGKYHWNVSPDLIHALAIGVAQGLAIHEHAAEYGRNPTIFSRQQSGRAPWLQVECDEAEDAAPEPATRLKLTAIDATSARLEMTPPQQGFAYEIRVNGIPLGRHNIPLVPQPDTARLQTIVLRDLPETVRANNRHEVQVITLNRSGRKSAPAVIQGVLFREDAVTRVPVEIAPGQSPLAGVSVIPVLDKYDVTGAAVGQLPDDYRVHNSIFDGRKIRLQAAAGEVVGFQVLLRGSGDVSMGMTTEDARLRVDLWQAVYVPSEGRLIPDPLLPLSGQVSLQSDRDTAVFADVFVPFDAAPGVRKGQVTVSDGRAVPVEITVLPFALPKEATFLCEMNGYGLPDHVNDYYALQQVAYDHRVHSNILHYSHNTAAPGARKSNLDMRLRSGRRMDNRRYDGIQPGATTGYWDDFAEAFGPYLDGSLFRDGHRGPIPAPGFYLTFHESWPLNCREFFNGDPDAYAAFRDRPEYAQTWVNILQDFARLAKARQWTKTGFQVYFNNKGSLKEATKAPWILDEPSGFHDYRALQYYGELTDRGRAAEPGVTIDYRVDISRPEYCRGQLDGRADLWVVSSWAFQHYRRLVTDRMERDGLKVWLYGTSNHVHESNRNIQAWALDARRFGATGLVPWQTVNKDGSALKRADQLGLFIYDKEADGTTVVRHSMRLKAWRDAQQLIEYLNLLQQRQRWSTSQLRDFVGQYVQLDPEVLKINDDDAGTSAYRRIASLDLEALRTAAAAMIAQGVRNP